ncbi:hypothetical protein [Micromonospora sp. NPDC005171]|uniref:hypothetical protein n=1 Tax=Micromonospora sp. NPDC005171 TaxID=3156866 RepID=UPI0033A74885
MTSTGKALKINIASAEDRTSFNNPVRKTIDFRTPPPPPLKIAARAYLPVRTVVAQICAA